MRYSAKFGGAQVLTSSRAGGLRTRFARQRATQAVKHKGEYRMAVGRVSCAAPPFSADRRPRFHSAGDARRAGVALALASARGRGRRGEHIGERRRSRASASAPEALKFGRSWAFSNGHGAPVLPTMDPGCVFGVLNIVQQLGPCAPPVEVPPPQTPLARRSRGRLGRFSGAPLRCGARTRLERRPGAAGAHTAAACRCHVSGPARPD